MPSPKNNSFWGMEHLVSKIYGAGNVVVDICANTMAFPEACIAFSEHRRFEECKSGKTYVKEDVPSLAQGYAQLLLGLEGHLMAIGEISDATRVFLQKWIAD